MKNFPFFKNLLCAFAFLFCIQTPIFGQFTDFQIIGPYDKHLGSYHIRTYINFVVNPSSPWLDTLEAEAYEVVPWQLTDSGVELSLLLTEGMQQQQLLLLMLHIS